jgi:hypothetical protein
MLVFLEFITVFVLGMLAGVVCAVHILIDGDDEEAPWWKRKRRENRRGAE